MGTSHLDDLSVDGGLIGDEVHAALTLLLLRGPSEPVARSKFSAGASQPYLLEVRAALSTGNAKQASTRT